MAVYLKSVGALVVLLGVLTGAAFVKRVAGDEAFQKSARARERNPGNVLFESEYRIAEAGHVFMIYSAVGCFLVAAIGGSLLWGLGALHAKLDGKNDGSL